MEDPIESIIQNLEFPKSGQQSKFQDSLRDILPFELSRAKNTTEENYDSPRYLINGQLCLWSKPWLCQGLIYLFGLEIFINYYITIKKKNTKKTYLNN